MLSVSVFSQAYQIMHQIHIILIIVTKYYISGQEKNAHAHRRNTHMHERQKNGAQWARRKEVMEKKNDTKEWSKKN